MVEYVCLIFLILTSISQKRFVSVEKSQKNISYATNYERNNHALNFTHYRADYQIFTPPPEKYTQLMSISLQK